MPIDHPATQEKSKKRRREMLVESVCVGAKRHIEAKDQSEFKNVKRPRQTYVYPKGKEFEIVEKI